MMRLAETAAALQAALQGADAQANGVSTDSRSVGRGELFVALRGEKYDGHHFVGAAARVGAAGALVDAKFAAGSGAAAAGLPLIVVEDTLLALGHLARWWRGRFSPVLIGIAGSNGKTTSKEMLASILRSAIGAEGVLATPGNLNNAIGLPLSLLRMRAGHRLCAIELGMNHPGEIAYLADIARPTIALVTNSQREHLEFMGSVEEVAAENGALYTALPADGIAVINAEDAYAATFRSLAAARRVVDFALDRAAALTGRYRLSSLSSEIRIASPAGEAQATLAIPGLHNVCNALAAAACAHSAGIQPQAIAEGLSAFRPYSGRLQVKRAALGSVPGATVIDDSYNANPDSVRAAIDVLAASPGRSVLVLGDMGEVGEQGADFHAEVGRYARERGVGAVLALGESTAHTVAAYGQGARHFATLEDLLDSLGRTLDPGTTVLVKGSRFMQMERVVAALTATPEEAH